MVESGTWPRLEALPDPRSPQGRIYPLACLAAIAICAFTAAGTTGSPRSASGSGRLARSAWPGCTPRGTPIAGRYRAPDEKTIRVVLDCLDPRALARALLGAGPRARRRSGGPSPASVCGYHARRAAQQAKTLARGRLRALALDGKTSRGARRADGTRVLFSPLWHLGVFPLFPVYDPASHADRRCSRLDYLDSGRAGLALC